MLTTRSTVQSVIRTLTIIPIFAAFSTSCKSRQNRDPHSEVKSYADAHGMICGDEPTSGSAVGDTIDLAYQHTVMDVLAQVPRFNGLMKDENIMFTHGARDTLGAVKFKIVVSGRT